MNRRETGQQYETLAAEYLKQQGYEILERNYCCRRGEIDLVAREQEYLVFVEVKYRRNAGRGFAAEAVTRQKQAKICRTADVYLAQHHAAPDTCVRFDVVTVDGAQIRLLRNAFSYCGTVRF